MFAISGRLAERRNHAGEIVARLRRLDEQHVGAGFAIHCGALDGALEALDRDRVGARDDQRLARVPRIDRGADLAAHLGRRDQRLAVEMPAALGKVLVLELDRVGAGALELADGAHDVERVAVAGVGIDDQMRSTRSRISASVSATSVMLTRPMSGRPSRV